MDNIKSISINWNNEDSIRRGEEEISKLVNNGWNHVKTISGIITSVSVYSKT